MMRKRLSIVVLLGCLLLTCVIGLVACGDDKKTTIYTVTFETDGGTSIEAQTIEEGSCAIEPTIKPEKEGYKFDKWEFDFSTPITSNTIINAKYIKLYTVTFETDGGTAIEAQTIEEGSLATEPTIIPEKLGYKFEKWEFDFSTPITSDTVINAVYKHDDKFSLPTMTINTEDGKLITSKDEYISCTVSVGNTKEKYEFNDYTAQIKGRGNTTWGMPKKPYKLQFVKSDTNDKKVNLFGNGKAKTWTLIANYGDKSLIRNYLAYSVGDVFSTEMPYTTSTQFIDLYLNGNYEGVYLLCEQVQSGSNRVEIAEDLIDDDKQKVAPDKVGYLLELDDRMPGEGVENVDYFWMNGKPFGIKTPDVEDENFSIEYVNYIKKYIEDCFVALDSNDYEEVKKYIDVESFCASYIVHELFNCIDCGHSSFYIYKDVDGVLCSGPLWDFDVSSGNCDYMDNSYDKIYAGACNTFYEKLLKYSEFKDLVKEKLNENKEKIEKVIMDCVDEVFDKSYSFEQNFVRWKIMGKYVWPNTQEIVDITDWKGQVRYVEWWLNRSLNFLIETYC